MSLEKAIKYAKRNPIKSRGRSSIGRFSAVLTNGYRSFIGFNSYKSSTLQAFFSKDPAKVCTHAEIAAIQKAIKGPYRDLSGYTMYVARLLADDSPALAKPCLICMKAIQAVGISDVEWTV